MMRKLVAYLVATLATLLLCSGLMTAQAAPPASGQSAPPTSSDAQQPNTVTEKDIEMLRQDLRDQRKQIVALNLPLTADEATKFWPIFDQYRKDAIAPNDERWAVIKAYAQNYSTMTDAQAQDYIKRSNAAEQSLLALRMRYVPMLVKAIGAKKTAMFVQIDRRVDLLINLQLSSMIPMVNAGAQQ